MIEDIRNIAVQHDDHLVKAVANAVLKETDDNDHIIRVLREVLHAAQRGSIIGTGIVNERLK